uniref:Uncharacterized protein n=1 Tax=Theropithecus gelada TaxID=9565 RepID=A0A8D2ES76_THEGE
CAPSEPGVMQRLRSEGLCMVNAPPCFAESIVFPRKSQENYKVYNLSNSWTLICWGKGKKL